MTLGSNTRAIHKSVSKLHELCAATLVCHCVVDVAIQGSRKSV